MEVETSVGQLSCSVVDLAHNSWTQGLSLDSVHNHWLRSSQQINVLSYGLMPVIGFSM